MIHRTRNYVLPTGEAIHTRKLTPTLGIERTTPLLKKVQELSVPFEPLDIPNVTPVGRHCIWAAFTDESLDPETMVGFLQAGPEVRGRQSRAHIKEVLNPLTAILPTVGVYTSIDTTSVVPELALKGVGTALTHTTLLETPRYNRAEMRVAAENTPMHGWAESIGFIAVDGVQTAPVIETDATMDFVRYRTPTDAAMAIFSMETTHPWLTEQAAAKARHPASQ